MPNLSFEGQRKFEKKIERNIMKENKDIEKLFERLEGTFDLHETPEGHQGRFLDKLNSQPSIERNNQNYYWRWAGVAAAIALLLMVGASIFMTDNTVSADLASVSPEMEKTQSFFTATIEKEIRNLKANETAENKTIIQDALKQMDLLEKEYQQLKKDLVESGQNKRVIQAMIANFQTRINLLENVIQTLEEIKTLKNTTNETLL